MWWIGLILGFLDFNINNGINNSIDNERIDNDENWYCIRLRSLEIEISIWNFCVAVFVGGKFHWEPKEIVEIHNPNRIFSVRSDFFTGSYTLKDRIIYCLIE